MATRIFRVTETENANDSNFDDDDWGSQCAHDAEQAAKLYAKRLNEDCDNDSDSEDADFDVSVKSEDGSIKRFAVHASLSWSYLATEKGDAL